MIGVSSEGRFYQLAPSGALTAYSNDDQTGSCSTLPVFEIMLSCTDYYVGA